MYVSSRTPLGCVQLGLLSGIAVLPFAATTGRQAPAGVSRFAGDIPASPGKPVVLEQGLNTLSETWTAPNDAVGDAISHDLEYRQGTSGDWIAGPQGVSGTRVEIGSLAPDTGYQVMMRTRNAAGHSEWLEPSEGGTALWAAKLTVGSVEGNIKWRDSTRNHICGSILNIKISVSGWNNHSMSFGEALKWAEADQESFGVLPCERLCLA